MTYYSYNILKLDKIVYLTFDFINFLHKTFIKSIRLEAL